MGPRAFGSGASSTAGVARQRRLSSRNDRKIVHGVSRPALT
ncbi:hypothetical protein HMPREF0185_02668 [Brevundimonas diminuta 470-4]|nr:hypothetical protein HMPREF0185_02668 [Brevundimonas diminuta 470-4]